MSEYQEFTGKTVEEALKNAREAFGLAGLNDLDFEILTPGSRGVLGMGAEPARIIAAPRAALGGAAPRVEAAKQVPLPAALPRRDDRPRDDRPRDDRPPRRDDRPREDRPRSDDRPPRRDDRPRDDRPREERAPRPERRDDRPPRRDDRGPRPAPGDDRRGSGLSQREAAEVETARAAHPAAAREEIQAADASPEALAAGREIVEQLIRLMGFEATVSVRTDGTPKIEIEGANDEDRDALGALIGRKGERLSALQHLVNLMLSRKMGEWTRVLVDVEDYRGRRERQLADLARRAADKVLESGTMLQLEPMPPLERRWVHIALKGIPGISTQSIGEEPERRVVILRADG